MYEQPVATTSSMQAFPLLSLICRTVTTCVLFASCAIIISKDVAMQILKDDLAGIMLLVFLTIIVGIIWTAKVGDFHRIVESDDDEDNEDNEEDDEEPEEEDDDCEKCGSGLEVYDPKPLCAECKAEVDYFARKNGVN